VDVRRLASAKVLIVLTCLTAVVMAAIGHLFIGAQELDLVEKGMVRVKGILE
jgi:hypothetical protein